MPRLTRMLRRFARDEDGLVLTEFVILIPMLIWTFVAMFIYWDTFRTINQAQKASYAVADLISRHDAVDLDFIDGMEKVVEYLSEQTGVKLRITSVQWDDVAKDFTVLFSKSPKNEMAALTATDIETIAVTKIPTMADGDSIVIVETLVDYTPAFEVGIPFSTFANFIVTRPRGEVKVCLEEEPCDSAL